MDHGLSCQKGGFIYRRHDEVKELIGHIANELYHDVEIEPNLKPISGEMLHHTANRQQDWISAFEIFGKEGNEHS